MTDARRSSPATARNLEPIRTVLARLLPPRGDVLEIAAGAGEHAAGLSRAFPALRWQPTDRDPDALASIDAWRSEGGPELQPARVLDVRARPWPVDLVDVVLCINLIHASPWPVTEALMAGAAEVLRPGGALITYGAYRIGGRHTAPSNETFDGWLKDRDPTWGVRDLEAVVAEATAQGLGWSEQIEMPANNFVLVFRSTS